MVQLQVDSCGRSLQPIDLQTLAASYFSAEINLEEIFVIAEILESDDISNDDDDG